MGDLRTEIIEEIKHMPDYDLAGLKEFLDTHPSPVEVTARRAPYDDEPYAEEERLAVEEAREWLMQNGGKGIPHEDVMRELGLR